MRIAEILSESAAWQRKEGKNKKGGLNKKGVASYRREHPGSKLQTAVTTEPSKLKKGSKAAKRRKSFCARMKGMKKSRTGAKTARDPNSRINKALRKWHCESIIENNNMLVEGMTFEPVVEKKFSDGETYWGSIWQRKEEHDCPYCHGTGHEEEDGKTYKCDYCYGKGKVNEIVSDAPELQVSNANGEMIQIMLGLDPDYSGIIKHKDLPAIMRRLIELKNRGSDQFTKDPSTTQGPMRRQSDDQGVTSIGRGPTMIDFGRSQEQVHRYIDQLIKIIQFAQKHNASLGWG